jgi:4-amino-4-deoxy-L-arabinose transferase-like glycosyltransferase
MAEAAAGEAPRRRPIPWPWVIFLLGLATSLAMIFIGFRSQGMVDTKFDPYYFGKMGKSLAEGRGFLPFGDLIHRRAPGYPLLIGGVYTIFGEQPLLVLLLQSLMLAGTCALVFDLGRRLFNQRVGIIAGAICALHPMMLRYVADLHLETMLIFLYTLMVWTTVRMWERPTVGRGVQVGLASALASLTKAVALLYPGIFALGLLGSAWLARRRGEKAALPILPLAVIFAVMAVVISPWTIRNYVVTGKFVPISTGLSDAFLRGLVFSKTEYVTLRLPPYTDAENESNEMFRNICRQAGAVWEANDWETDQILNRAAKERLKAEPGKAVRKFFVGLATFWYQLTSLKNSVLVGGLALVVWVFAIIGWRRARREGRPSWLLFAPILYLNLFLAALLALGRYSAPVLPALFVMAALGIDTVLLRLRGRAPSN